MKYLLLAAFVGAVGLVMVWWVWFIEVRDPLLEGRTPADDPGTTAVAPHAAVPAEALGTVLRATACRADEQVIAGLRGARPAGRTRAMAGRQVQCTAGPHARVVVVSVVSGMNGRPVGDPASIGLLAGQDPRDDPLTAGHG